MKSDKTATLLVVTAGVCWGLISIFVRALSSLGFSSLGIVGIRAWLCALMLGIYFVVKDRTLFKIELKDIWMFAGSGIVSMTFFTYCYFSSIVLSGAAVSVVMMYTSPIFVMLMSAVVFKEKITGRKILALIMTFCGCVLVAGLVGSSISLGPKALLLGLGSGFGYALYSIFAGIAVRKYSSLTVTFWTMVFSGISMLFLINIPELFGMISSTISHSWYYMVGIAFFCTLIPYLTYTKGLSKMDAGEAAVLVTVEPVVGSLLGIFAWKEPFDLMKLLGMVLIFSSVVILSKKK